MKYLILLLSVLCALSIHSTAQYLPKSIEPYRITVSRNKTTNLIFPSSIKSVDRGSENVLAQKAPGIENILQLKAGEENLTETNLTVVTVDGHFYSFAISYNPNPGTLNYSFVSDSSQKAIVSGQPITAVSYSAITKQILQQKSSIHKIAVAENMWLGLRNLFIKDNMLWLHMTISNHSLIPFTPSFLRVFIEDRKEVRNTAIQQSEIVPLIGMPLQTVAAHSEQSYVFVCYPFSIPATKHLMIQAGEAEGSRQLTLELTHRIMKKIRSLPQLTNN